MIWEQLTAVFAGAIAGGYLSHRVKEWPRRARRVADVLVCSLLAGLVLAAVLRMWP